MIRLLVLLLRSCPRAFREAYGADILELYAARRARLQGSSRARLALLRRTAIDIVLTAAAEWKDRLGRSAPVHDPDPARLSVLDRFSLDLRDAARRLAAAPGFAFASILILAIGIGGAAAIFSAVDAFVLRERPFASPHELLFIYQDSDEGRPSSSSYPAFVDIAAHGSLFSGVGAVMPEGTGTLLTSSGDAEVVHLEFATSSYFPALGLQPAVGRWFLPDEDRPGAPPAAVLTHAAWQRRFAGDPAILGRSIRISGASVTVVGVGPATYNGFVPGLSSEAWLSISSLGPVGGAFRERTLRRREDHWFQVAARLAAGRTVQDAQAAMNALAERLGREFPETDRGRRITVASADRIRVHPDIDAVLYPAAGVPLLVAGLVLVVVCSNLANLTLARGAARRREFAVRLAIGATRGQVVRSLALESLLLSVAGGALGLLLAEWAIALLHAWNAPPPFNATTTFSVDFRVVQFALVLSILTGLAFGLLPALRSTRTDLRQSLRADISGAVRVGELRGALIALQIAVSVALLAGSGILLRSLTNALAVDIGFDARPLAAMTVDAGQSGRPEPQAIQVLLDLRQRVSALPGIEGAALTTRAPVTVFGPSSTLVLDEHATPGEAGMRTVEVRGASVTPDYFRTLGIPLLRGREFSDRDRQGADRVAIVSRTMAERFWGTTDVVGRRYRAQGNATPWTTIVGVVGDITIESPGEPPAAFLYRPFGQAPWTRATLIARTATPSAVLPLMRQEARGMDSLLPVTQVAPMEEHVARSLALPRAAATVLTSVGLLAVVLACLGVYAVVAFSVARRRTEMGVRMALGATTTQVTRLVLREMVRPVVIGLVAGTALAVLLTPALRGLLVGVEPLDVRTFLAVSGLVAAVAMLTTWFPARRAARTDPAAVLRAE
jgi:predicted permease